MLAGVGLYWDSVNETFNIDDTVVTKDMLSGITNSNFNVPSLNSTTTSPQIVVNITAGLGTDPYALGREVSNALRKYGTVSAYA